MKKLLATLVVSAGIAGAASAGDFGISLNFGDCGGSYYPSYRSYSYCPPVRYYCPPPVVVYREPYSSCGRGYYSYRPTYYSGHHRRHRDHYR